MTYREVLETLNGMMRDGSSPQEVATYLASLDRWDHAAVFVKLRAFALPGTFGAAVVAALDPQPAKSRFDRKREDAENPVYPNLTGVAKWRKLASKRELSAEETKAYGRSVLEGIRQLQRQEIMRGAPRLPSAKYETGADVLKRIAAENKARCEADIRADRARRTDAQIIAAYEAAMVAKRAAEAPKAEPALTVVPASKPAKPAPDHSARMRKAWETRRANAAKRAA